MKVPVNHVALSCGKCRGSTVGFLELRDGYLTYWPKVARGPEPDIPADLPAGATIRDLLELSPDTRSARERFERSWAGLSGHQVLNRDTADKPIGERPIHDRFEATCPTCGYRHRRRFQSLLGPVSKAIRAGRTTYRLT